MRLIGHRDGVVTALLRLREKIAGVKRQYEHTPPRHRKVRAKADAILRPLLDLEQRLAEENQNNLASIAQQQTALAVTEKEGQMRVVNLTRVVHCWEDGPRTDDDCGTTCLLPDGHGGSHVWTRDDECVVSFGHERQSGEKVATNVVKAGK